MKKIRLILLGSMLVFSLVGCSDKESDEKDNVSIESNVDTEKKTEATTEGNTSEELSEEVTEETSEDIDTKLFTYSNSGNTYSLTVDDYVSFTETTTDVTSNVNNEDGLELNYNDTFITIQRYPSSTAFPDVKAFYDYLSGDSYLSMVVAEDEVEVNNSAISEYIVQTLETKSGNYVFTGYIYYFKTENGYYKALISGSEADVIEHYKNFVDNMSFN